MIRSSQAAGQEAIIKSQFRKLLCDLRNFGCARLAGLIRGGSTFTKTAPSVLNNTKTLFKIHHKNIDANLFFGRQTNVGEKNSRECEKNWLKRKQHVSN